MTAERWKRIAAIYDSVVEAPPDGREALLGQVCQSDKDLRREIESLLDARERAEDFLSPDELHAHIRGLSVPEAAPGKRLGRYEILSAIGAGGMGEVYLAHDAELNRRVALKVLPAQFTRDEERVVRFRREARAASALSHPNIVTIYDVGRTGETWFIATEFVEGVTLRSRLAERTLAIPEALGIALQCASGLEAAHDARIVHGDVKPENILVRPDGVVKIVDFGLARSTQNCRELFDDATQSGAVVGTPRYMSPEQARGQKLDGRSDIFSLGAVMYEMIARQPAFRGATNAEVFAALLNSEPEPLTSSGLNAMMRNALAKDRDCRYQTMHDFAVDLRRFGERPQNLVPAVERLKSTQPLGGVVRDFPKNPRLSRRAILTGAGALGAGLSLYRLRSKRPGNAAQDGTPTVTPLTSFAGYKDYGSFSPDGERIVFSWNGGQGGSGGRQERDIYIKKISGGEPVRLTFAQQDDTHAAWSPDRRSIAFCRLMDNQTPYMRFAISIVPVSGGAERKITEGGEGVSWSPDGRTLAVAGLPPDSGGIFQVSLENGARTRLTGWSPHLDELPVFSPDGKWIVFTRSFGPRARELFVVPASGGSERQLTFEQQPTYGAAWTGDSKEIVFSSNQGGGGESLWRIPLGGGTPRRLASTFGGAFYPSISRKGDQLIYTESFRDTNNYLSEGAGFNGRSVLHHFGSPRGLIVSSRRDDSPNILGTDDRIAFVSKRTGNEEIWICDRDGRNPLQMSSFAGPDTGTPRWSPDGRWVAFDSSAAGNPNIYIVSVEGGPPRKLTSGPHGNYMPSWSVDGKRIYFKSDRSGSDQIWSITAQGGGATQITRSGACEAFSSPDGKLLYYTKRGWGAIWTVPAEGGPEEPVPELQRYDRIFRSWGVIRDGIYFMSREQGPRQTVWFFSFATRQVSPLLTLDKEPIWSYPDVALSADGSRLLTAHLDQEVNDLMLIQNFR
jgi:Tol biopolymer transport system component